LDLKKISKNNNIFIGYQMRYDQRINLLKKHIRKNKKYYANITWLTSMPVWHQNENYLKSYSSQKKLGGGVTLTLSHEIDLAYYIFGKVKSISVINLKNTLNIDVEDKIIVYLEHYNGCISRVYLNFASRFSERKIEVYDQKSKLIYDFNKNYIYKNSNIKKNNYKCHVNKDKIYLLEIVDFINSIKLNKNSTCRINIKNTFHTQKVLNKIIKKINLKYCLSV
jgi:predicted dehydrogenase